MRRAATVERKRRIEAARRELMLRDAARFADARRLQQFHRQQEEGVAREAYLQQLRHQRRPSYCSSADADEVDDDDEADEFAPQSRCQSVPTKSLPCEDLQGRASDSPGSSPALTADIFESQRPRREIRVSIPSSDSQDIRAANGPPSVARSRSHSPVPQARPATLHRDSERHAPAASTIQNAWRAHIARKRALAQIAAIDASFQSLQSTFAFPTSVDFVQSSAATSLDTPALAYTEKNRPVLAFEDSAMRFLTQLDAVDSAGDVKVRAVRKESVNRIEASLKALENQKADAWQAHQANTSLIPSLATSIEASDEGETGKMEKPLVLGAFPDLEQEEAEIEAKLSELEDAVIVDGHDIEANAWGGTLET